MTVCVFVGPTLPVTSALEILDAIYLPPARRGDIVKTVRAHAPDTLVLIDGYFEQVPSVWHKEILWALNRGIVVYGAASMGALRAAELAQFGMIGVGRVFESYVVGKFDPFLDPFEDDDEVAIVHGPAEIGYPATEAMVDIRASLVEAGHAGVLAADEIQSVAANAKSLFYKNRTWDKVLAKAGAAGMAETRLSVLRDWLKDNRRSQKRLDAEAVLQELAEKEPVARGPVFRFERTVLWQSMMMELHDGEGE